MAPHALMDQLLELEHARAGAYTTLALVWIWGRRVTATGRYRVDCSRSFLQCNGLTRLQADGRHGRNCLVRKDAIGWSSQCNYALRWLMTRLNGSNFQRETWFSAEIKKGAMRHL